MRILYVCADTGIDVLGHKGASIHVRAMIAAFRRAGHAVELVTPRLTKPGAAPAAVDATVRRVRVPDEIQRVKLGLDTAVDRHTPGTSLPKDVRRVLYDDHLVARLDEMYGDDPPDLVYVRAAVLSTAGVELARSTGRPLVVELNAPLAVEHRRYRGGALDALATSTERALLSAATAVMVVSDELARHVQRIGVDPAAVHVVPNAIDPERFAPNGQRRHDPPVLGFVGGLRPWHGVDSLVDVLRCVRRRFPTTRLVVAGDGPGRLDIERTAAAHGLTDAVTLLGSVDHDAMPEVIHGFTVALAPYPLLDHDFYFSPLKVFEYLGCGAPVVASRVGQIADLIADREHARLVPPGDTAAVAAACCELIADPIAARAMGRRGADLVHRLHTWDGNAAAATAIVGAGAVSAPPTSAVAAR